MGTNNETLGGRIQALRLAAGMTQERLGKESGCGAPNIRNWEQGHRTPNVFAVFKLAQAVGLPMERFVVGVDEGEDTAPRRKPAPKKGRGEATARAVPGPAESAPPGQKPARKKA